LNEPVAFASDTKTPQSVTAADRWDVLTVMRLHKPEETGAKRTFGLPHDDPF
jgi:hypothetical protein